MRTKYSSHLVIVAIWLLPFILKAQNGKTYTGMECGAPIPIEILKSAREKTYEDINSGSDGSESRKTLKDEAIFYTESNFYIDDLLTSGKVIFNNDVYNYINKVANKILKNDLQTRYKLQFYPVKSPAVNAFSTDRGIIFINIGLLSHLENEAQLAFILAHEIAHYVKKHNLNFYFESKRIDRKNREYQRSSTDDTNLEKNRYSRENEFEADEYGFDLFSQAGYDESAALTVMDLLLHAELPYKYDIAYEKTQLESKYMKFPSVFFSDSISPVSIKQDEEDKYSSHPNTLKRKEALKSKMGAISRGELFLVSQIQFIETVYLCKHEQLTLLLKHNNYLHAIYYANVLAKESADSLFIKKGVAKALSGLSRYGGTGEFRNVVPRLSEVKELAGEPQRIYYLFNYLKPEEITVVALRYTWDLFQQFPDDLELKELCKSVIVDYKIRYGKNLNRFANIQDYNDTIVESYYANFKAKDEKSANSKKFSKKVLSSKKAVAGTFTMFALSDLKTDKKFQNFFNEVDLPVSLRAFESTESILDDKKETETGHGAGQSKKSEDHLNFLKDTDVPVQKLLILDPEYLFVDMRKEHQINYAVSEEKKENLSDLLLLCASKSGLEVELMNTKDIEPSNIKLFNEVSLLKERTDELFRNESLVMAPVDYSKVKQLADEHGTRFICLITSISLIEKKDYYDYYNIFFIGVFAPFYLPFVIHKMASKQQATMMVIAIYDALSGQVTYHDVLAFPTKDRDDIIKSQVYNIFVQLKLKQND